MILILSAMQTNCKINVRKYSVLCISFGGFDERTYMNTFYDISIGKYFLFTYTYTEHISLKTA